MKRIVILIIGFICLASLAGCGKKEQPASTAKTGTITFTANGEDFVRQGFMDKQGWNIAFEKLYVNIADPVAYGAPGEAVLKGSFQVDLAEGDEDAGPVTVGKSTDAEPGNYQSLKFKIRRADSGEYKGCSIVMIGNAEKGETEVPFIIKLTEEMDYNGKEGYVGDQVKGMLPDGGDTEVEMTFHFDHIFGDKEAAADDHINTGSVGFDFFNQFAEDGKVNVSQGDMAGAEGYGTLVNAVWSLGHLGEGHCVCANQSSADSVK